MDSERQPSALRLDPPPWLRRGSGQAGTTSVDTEDDPSTDDDLLMVAIGLVKSAGYDGQSHFAARVALVFEALRKAHRR